MYRYNCDRLYFGYVLSLLSTHLKLRLVYGHFFFCQRKNYFDSKCKFCNQVVRWGIDHKVDFKFERYFIHGWADFKSDIFCSSKFYSDTLNKKLDGCCYFESLKKPREITEMLATITIRIMLNIFKRVLFTSEGHVKLTFYSYLGDISKEIFQFACEKIDVRFANLAFEEYRPNIDYNA